MAITVQAFTGSSVTISTTEISMINGSSVIASNATAGIYQGFVDATNLAAGDTFEYRCYETAITGGAQRLVYYARFGNAQGTPLYASPTLILGVGWDMTLIKSGGTDRPITWRISKVA